MRRGWIFVVIFCAAILGAFSACAVRVNQIESGFAALENGASESALIQKLGSPDVVETSVAPFVVYSSASCNAPCVRRLWWEHPILKGMEAWSVELGSTGSVMNKAHWISP